MIRITVFVVIVFFTTIFEKVAAQQTIKIEVTNVASDEGTIGFAIYQKEGFLQKPVFAKSSKIVNRVSTVVFENVPKGMYAVSCYHDQNNNKKMDFTPQGMPLEDYGVSNNKINPYGPPLFEDAKFEVNDKKVLLKIKF